MADAPAKSLTTGQRLKSYVIESVLGEGGISTTYLARRIADDKAVTIREYFPRGIVRRGARGVIEPVSDAALKKYAAGLERFVRKAINLSSNDAGTATRVLECFEANSTAYLVMDDRNGGSRIQPSAAPDVSIIAAGTPVTQGQARPTVGSLIDLGDTVDTLGFEADQKAWTKMLSETPDAELALAAPIDGHSTLPAGAPVAIPSAVPPAVQSRRRSEPAPTRQPDVPSGRSMEAVSAAQILPEGPPAKKPVPPITPKVQNPPSRVPLAAAIATLFVLAGGVWLLNDQLAGPLPTASLPETTRTGLSKADIKGPADLAAEVAEREKTRQRAAAALKAERRARDARQGKEALAHEKLDAERSRVRQAVRRTGPNDLVDKAYAYEQARREVQTAGNYAEAIKWYQIAAEQGHAQAQFALGHMYDVGKGVDRDPAKAAKWFRLAAQQGHVDAQYNVAFMYANGTGVQKDYGEALRWFRKAAEQCDLSSQANIGVMYEKGWGVDRDLAEAYFWYRLAAATHGKNPVKTDARLERISIRAEMAAERMRARLTSAQERLARSRVGDWKPTVGKNTPAWCRS